MLIVVIGRRATVIEEDVYQDTVGAGYMNNIPKVARNIVIAFFIGYLAGAVLMFFKMRSVDDFSLSEAVWQSLFLSVSALNNAGFSILPNAAGGSNADTLGAQPFLMAIITPMIILGAFGWPLVVDISATGGSGFAPRLAVERQFRDVAVQFFATHAGYEAGSDSHVDAVCFQRVDFPVCGVEWGACRV